MVFHYFLFFNIGENALAATAQMKYFKYRALQKFSGKTAVACHLYPITKNPTTEQKKQTKQKQP